MASTSCVRAQRSVKAHLVSIHVDLVCQSNSRVSEGVIPTYVCVQSRRESYPNILITESPCSEVKNRVIRISFNFPKEFRKSFRFGWKFAIDIGSNSKGTVQIQPVKPFITQRIGNKDWVPY